MIDSEGKARKVVGYWCAVVKILLGSVDSVTEFVKVPIAILGAEIDHLSPLKLVKQFDEILSAKPKNK
ncbi:putative endo-1,3-1,4-beta-d-glucanase [Corchorus olitorius]|uniref:Endo-1,3-1,4-beta-d-glucanase n=1 Tax=Corchorus olitorius TaxID=93759 RepID=A0A1R3KS68_9ROSI|nr:putative endo-1,3-1,4-beta-d-glucanase [Corchorus olitorius]